MVTNPIPGAPGDDDLVGTSLSDTFTLSDGGSDTARGKSGKDFFDLGATLDATDRLDGGNSSDTIMLNGNYSALLTLDALTLQHIERMELIEGVGNAYNIKTDDGTVAAGETLVVANVATGTDTSTTFDGSAETDGHFRFIAGSGTFTAIGGAQADWFNLRNVDGYINPFDVSGGQGADVFRLHGSALTDTDHINGGAGNDTVYFTGTTILDLDSSKLRNVETFVLQGRNADFNLTLDDSVVGKGKTLTIDATDLGPTAFPRYVVIDATDETNGGIDVIGGFGTTTLFLASTRVLNASSYDGTIGDDDGLALAGNMSAGVTLSGSQFQGMEYLGLANGRQNVALDDNFIAAGKSLYLDLTFSDFSDFVRIDATAETDGILNFHGGIGAFNLKIGSSAVLDGSKINGGIGRGILELTGPDFASGYQLGGVHPIKNLLQVTVDDGFDYNFTMTNTSTNGLPLTIVGRHLSAGHSLTFDGSALTRVPVELVGGAGDDVLIGSNAGHWLPADLFMLSRGGDDTAYGNAGWDVFRVGGSLNADDTIDGGAGRDVVVLHGDYSGANALTLAAPMLSNVEIIALGGGFDYDLTGADDLVAAGKSIRIDGSFIRPNHALTYDASAETDGFYTLIGGAGDDVLTGAQTATSFNLFAGGDDTATGNASDDIFRVGGALTAADTIVGGGGNDMVVFSGDYSTTLTLGANTISGIEKLHFTGNFTFGVIEDDGNVAAGAKLVVDVVKAPVSTYFDGRAETDGSFIFNEGGGADVLVGGAGDDRFVMHGTSDLSDIFRGEGGVDTYVYSDAGQSSSTTYDTFADFAAGTDKFDLPTLVTSVAAVAGSVSTASFDADLTTLGVSNEHVATVLTVTGGTLAGSTFLIVDGDGTTSYNAGGDYVFNITGYTGTITTGDFI